MFYFVKTPWWLKKFSKGRVWQMPNNSKIIYLSFDDGPDPLVTPFVLDELKKYDARASFFCVGNNVVKYPQVYERILKEGHAVGNHSFDHLNGWKTNDKVYLDSIAAAKKHIISKLFRPPYGRIKRSQQKILSSPAFGLTTIMWTVLSGDFDGSTSPVQCYTNVTRSAKNGSIVVFHDSAKANTKMSYALPLVLKYFSEKGYRFEKIQVG